MISGVRLNFIKKIMKIIKQNRYSFSSYPSSHIIYQEIDFTRRMQFLPHITYQGSRINGTPREPLIRFPIPHRPSLSSLLIWPETVRTYLVICCFINISISEDLPFLFIHLFFISLGLCRQHFELAGYTTRI